MSKRWPNGEVPYVIEDAFDDNFRVINMAIIIVIAIIIILLSHVWTITLWSDNASVFNIPQTYPD